MFGNRVRNGRFAVIPLALAGALILGACSSDDEGDDATEEPTATASMTAEGTGTAAATGTAEGTATATEAMGETVEVTAVDYGFEGLPETVAVGSTITFTNSSANEFHEFVAIKLPEGETRTPAELMALPEAEQEALIGQALPAMVLVAGPGEDGIPVLGSGEVSEPGRYLVLCAIPIGADPEAVAEAMATATTEAPELEGGPPHFTAGMVGEFTAE